jgi:hypothetical protein
MKFLPFSGLTCSISACAPLIPREFCDLVHEVLSWNARFCATSILRYVKITLELWYHHYPSGPSFLAFLEESDAFGTGNSATIANCFRQCRVHVPAYPFSCGLCDMFFSDPFCDILAAGESLTPYIVTSENSSPVQEQLRKQGVRLGRDLMLKSDHRRYVNAEAFLDDITTVFLSCLVGLRGLAGFATEDAVLLADNCSVHGTDDATVFSLRQGYVSQLGHHIQLRSFRSLAWRCLVFSRGVRGMNCRLKTIMQLSSS